MLTAFVITLREGLEMALIVGIIFAYLARTGHRREFTAVWTGVAAAVGVSGLAGTVIVATAGEFTGRGEQLFEGSAMLAAVVLLTYMIFWMRRQAVTLRRDLQTRLSTALQMGSGAALVALTVTAVGREGIETALFLFAATRASAPLPAVTGALVGLAAAVALGLLIYRGSYRLNLRTFFNVTSLVLLLVGAGLLVRGVGELQEAGLISPVVRELWNTGAALPETSPLGSLLQAVFGYISAPSLAQVAVYAGYLLVVARSYVAQPERHPLAPPAQGVRTAIPRRG